MSHDLPNYDLSGSLALVTGASRGIGRAAALALAHAGADLLLGVRPSSDVAELASSIRDMGRRVDILHMDAGVIDRCLSAIDKTIEQVGPIDILVNNVGGGIADAALDVTPTGFDQVMSLNVKAAFFISQVVARNLIEVNRGGNIINVSSQASLVALPGESVYCLAKAAVSHMTRCLAVEWGEYGIRVNAVCPTFIETPGTAKALSKPAFKQDTIDRIAALHRLGQPREVAGAIAFLASPAASLITGHNLVIDGGWTIR